MSKIIKSSVSVPASLYVYREADAQLRNVIDGMSRPGYISVARQMGKTSLLQHTKKQLQDEQKTIVYFDLSATVYSSAKQYFRYIIDTIIEVQDHALNKVGRIIRERRREIDEDYSASGEHDKELRLILNALPGVLVIILDEVDALAKADFSDEIFAQIRSVYFMRNTHDVLHNITYVLSGVIEPAKLIKNKDNSPFNIATQIFLDDFTFKEYLFFIEKSKLAIDTSVIERIYHWTSGNPRMTYDMCSAVEDVLLQQEVVGSETIDRLVRELYLTEYNKAPIDHIRDIVLNNAIIRNAIKSLKRQGSLSDELVSQLYLYGIIESKFKSPIPKIKNRIIDAALSDSWLNEVDKQEKGLYDLGLERIDLGFLKEGVEYLLQYVEAGGLSQEQQSGVYFAIANTYHKLGDFAESNGYLDRLELDKDINPDDYYLSVFIKSLNYFSQNQRESGFSALKDVIDNGVKNKTYYTALSNYGFYLVIQDFDKYHAEAISVFNKAIEQVSASGLPKQFKDHTICSVSFRLAATYERLGNQSESYEYYKKALAFSTIEIRPVLLIGLVDTSLASEKSSYAKQLLDTINNPGLSFTTRVDSEIDFSEKSLLQSLGTLYKFNKSNYINLLNYCISHYYKDALHISELICLVSTQSRLNNAARTDVEEMLLLSLKCDGITDRVKAKCYIGLALAIPENTPEFVNKASKAIAIIESLADYGLLNRDDIFFLVRCALFYRDTRKPIEALRFISYLATKLDAEDEKMLTGDCIVIYYIMASVNGSLGNLAKESEFYNKALGLEGLWRKDESQMLILIQREAVNSLLSDIAIVLNSRKVSAVAAMAKLLEYKKFPRNSIITVRYRDGRTLTGKIKKFTQDLEAGQCAIV